MRRVARSSALGCRSNCCFSYLTLRFLFFFAFASLSGFRKHDDKNFHLYVVLVNVLLISTRTLETWPVIVAQDRLQEQESRMQTGTWPIVVAQDRLREPESWTASLRHKSGTRIIRNQNLSDHLRYPCINSFPLQNLALDYGPRPHQSLCPISLSDPKS
jgi:hypothetical protein